MNKHFKRFSTALILVLIFSICFTLVNFAQEAIENDGGVTTPQNGSNEQIDPSTSVAEGEEGNTTPQNGWEAFIDVIKAVVGEDFIKIGSMVIEIALLVLMVVLRKTNKVSLTDIVTAVSAKNGKGERVSLAEVVAALNKMVGDNDEELKAFKAELSQRVEDLARAYSVQTVTHEQVAELTKAAKAMLQMFHTVYSHSKTIGANVKEEEGYLYNEAIAHIAALEKEDSANVEQT